MFVVDFGYEYQRIIHSFKLISRIVFFVSSLIFLILFMHNLILPLIRCVVS